MDTETDIEAAHAVIPIVCTLTAKAGTEQALQWVDLQHSAIEVSAISGGVRMTFPASMVDNVEDLARRERACCAFLTIDTSVTNDVLTLDITSPNPEALTVICALVGISRP